MTKTKQRKITVLVSAIFVLALIAALFVLFNPTRAGAENIIEEGFDVAAAQVKQYQSAETSGSLRFVVKVSKGVYDTYSPDKGYTYGTILLPTNMLGENVLTLDTGDILNIETEKWQSSETDASGDVINHVYTSVVNSNGGALPQTYNDRPIAARAYIKSNSGDIYYSPVSLIRSVGYVATMNVAAAKWEAVDIDLASGMAGTKTDVALTDTETALGITSVKEYTFGGFQNAAFAGLDLTEYESVKFYMYRPSTGGGCSVYDATDGGYSLFYFNPNDSWVEIELKKGESGYDIYVNGTKNTKALKNDVALTNLNQLALNGSSGTVKYSNVVAIKSASSVLVNIANNTTKSASFDKTTLVNGADKIIPNISFGGVSVPEEQLSLLDIDYTTSGSAITVGDSNVITPNGTGTATVSATLNIPGFAAITAEEKTIIAHALNHYDAVAATCDIAGNCEYWYCSGCKKSYSDENAVNELESTEVAALGHTYEEAYRMDPTYTEKGYIFKACARCKDEISESKNALGHKVIEGTATLAGGSSYTNVALTELGGATEYANPSGYAASGASWADGVDYIFSNVQKGTINGTSTATNFFRITLNIDFTQNKSTSFEFGMNYDKTEGVKLIIGGKTVDMPVKNAWNKFTIMGDGSVYLNDEQISGAQMTGNKIVFEINKGDSAPYAQFVIKKAVSYVKEAREYELTLGDVTSAPITKLGVGGTALIPVAADPAIAEKTISGVKQNVISQQIQKYKNEDDTTVEWNYFRYTLEINFKQFESITIPVATNVITGGAFDVYVNGVKGVITTGNTWSYIKVMQDGTVYFDGTLMEGALVEDYVVIELDTHRPTGTYYGEFYIGTPTFTLAEDTPIYNWEALDIDLGANLNGTKTDGNVGYAEDKLGITSVTEFTFADWQNSALATLDLTKYEMVKFYLYRPSTNGGGAIYDQGNGGTGGGIVFLSDYADEWVEIILKKSVYGDYYNLYVNGERQRVVFKDGEEFTNLNQLALNGSSGKIKYSDVKVVPIPVTEPVWETLGNYDLASGMGGTKTDVTLTATETALGITKVTQYTFTAWQNTAFASLDLTKYESVKFYMYRPSSGGGGSAYDATDGSYSLFYFNPNDSWVEILIKQSESGTGYDLYANGTKATALKNSAALTNLNQIALNGSTGTIKYSNVQVVVAPSDEKWDALDIDLASGMGGTRTDVTLTDTETALGITSVKEYKFAGWQNAGFASLDLTQYESVKFYMYRPSTNGAGAIYETANGSNAIVFLSNYADTWVEIELIRGTSGYDIYVNGTKVTFTLKDNATLTNLNQLAINGNSTTATLKYSNIMVPHEPALEYVTDKNYNLASGMAGTKTDVTLTDTETALGITFAKEYTFAGWQNTGFASLDLTKYETVKFYMYRPSTNGGGHIYETANGGNKIVSLDGNKLDTWVEIELRKGTSGYDIYANGAKVTFTLKDGATLTNLNQLALNGSSGTIKYSNISVTYAGYYVEPGIEYDEEETNNDYTIVFESDDTQVNFAAIELQSYFKEATGTLLFKNPYRGVNSIKGNMIVLGVLPATDKGYDLTELGKSDYVIKKDGNVIYIYGATGYGVINGVYALLGDLFDLKFYYEDTYTMTENKGYALTAADVEEVTSNMTFDYIFSGLGELKPEYVQNGNENYAHQMGFVTDYKVDYNNVHNATTLLEEYRSTHPEWFYTPSGAAYGQIYLSAENFATGDGTLVTTVAEKLFEMLQKDTQYEREIALIFSAMDEDIWPHGTGYENSDALFNKYGTYAAENIMFMNAVAKELDAMMAADPLGRTIQLELLCYNKTLVAPETSGLSEADLNAIKMYKGTNISVVPMIAPVEGNRYLSFEDSRNKVKNPATGEVDKNSKTIAQVIEGWEKLANGNDMHMWWYASDGFDFFVMMDTITNMQANYKFAAEHGITIMYNQSQNNAVAPDWSRLKIYIQSQLQKDVNCDVDALIDEWMDVYFGAGAESMKTLLSEQKTWYGKFFEAAFVENQGHYTAGGFAYSDGIAKWHFTESPKKPTFSFMDSTKNTMLVTWMGYIDSAKAAIDADTSLSDAEKTELKNRVDLESLTIRYTLIEVFETKTYDQSTSAFYQFAKSLGVTRSAEGTLIP